VSRLGKEKAAGLEDNMVIAPLQCVRDRFEGSEARREDWYSQQVPGTGSTYLYSSMTTSTHADAGHEFLVQLESTARCYVAGEGFEHLGVLAGAVRA
jgi:hypothetical protein